MSKILYRGLQWFLALFAAYILFFSGSDRYFLGPVSLLFLLIPRMVERLFRMELGYPLKITVLIFCFLGFHLGTALRWFDRGWGYDNVVHLLSGILFTLIGLCFYARIRGGVNRKEEPLLQITYAFFFSVFVAVLWEIWEFSGFLLFGLDSQHHLDTGVFDTMEDIIACLAGSLVMTVDYVLYLRRDMGLLMGVVERFDAANGYVKTQDPAPLPEVMEPSL